MAEAVLVATVPTARAAAAPMNFLLFDELITKISGPKIREFAHFRRIVPNGENKENG